MPSEKKSKKTIVDAALTQKGEVTVINRDGKILILYRLPQGYAIFRQVDDEALSVELNNFCADVYERGRKKFAASVRRNLA